MTPPPTPGNYPEEATQTKSHSPKRRNERLQAKFRVNSTKKMKKKEAGTETANKDSEEERKRRAQWRQKKKERKRERKRQRMSTSMASKIVEQVPLPAVGAIRKGMNEEEQEGKKSKTERQTPLLHSATSPSPSPINNDTPPPPGPQPNLNQATKPSPVAWDHSPPLTPWLAQHHNHHHDTPPPPLLFPTTHTLIHHMRTAQHTLHLATCRYEHEIKVDRAKPLAYPALSHLEEQVSRTAALCHDFFIAEYAFRDVLDENRGEGGFDVGRAVREFGEGVRGLVGEWEGTVE